MKSTEKRKRPNFSEAVCADFYAMEKSKATLLKIAKALLIRPRFSAVFLFRCSSSLYRDNKFAKILSRFFWLFNYYLNGCEISARAIIAPGLNLPHPNGVIIGMATLGRNVNVLQHVTIGQRDFTHFDMQNLDLANIDDDVNIFVGAVIVGSVRIGKGATIGANAVVTRDVPPFCTAVGVPARIIQPKAAH